MAGYREKKRILPVGASAIYRGFQQGAFFVDFNYYLAYTQDVINIQALEERPHREIDVN